MTQRAAIYTRFSTDRQNENSTADQEATARAYAVRNGYDVVAVYADAALSGGSVLGRDGLADLLADARSGRFQFVLVEALDRLSRDMEDLAGIHKRLTFAGVQIVALHEGIASTVQVGLRGLVGQLFREDNAQKTRRGMSAKIRAGLFASGKPYGYAVGQGEKGAAVIIEDEAAIIRRIYTEYVDGQSPRQIAYRLNAEGVPGPRGGPWQSSAIYGWEKRGTGILRNTIYDGRMAWNRTRFIKDPDTGRRVSRPNAAAEVETMAVEHLRIVPAALFAQAQALCSRRTVTAVEAGRMKRPTRLLSGLLRCSACGGGMSVVGKDKSGRERIVCTTHKERHGCPAPKTFYLDIVEDLTIDTLRSELRNPENLAAFMRGWNDARLDLVRTAAARQRELEKRASGLEGQLQRITRLLREGIGDERRLGADMKAQQAELDGVLADIAREPDAGQIITLHPATIDDYEKKLGQLKVAIEAGAMSPQLGQHLRDLVDTVTVRRHETKRAGVDISITGRLRNLLNISMPPESVGSFGCGGRI